MQNIAVEHSKAHFSDNIDTMVKAMVATMSLSFIIFPIPRNFLIHGIINEWGGSGPLLVEFCVQLCLQ
jgi:hypothetical protein